MARLSSPEPGGHSAAKRRRGDTSKRPAKAVAPTKTGRKKRAGNSGPKQGSSRAKPLGKGASARRRGRWSVGRALTLAALALSLVVGGLLRYWTWMPGDSFRGTPPALESADLLLQDALWAHVWKLGEDIGERNPQRPTALLKSAAYIRAELRGFGYRVSAQRFDVDGASVSNLVAVRRAQSADAGVLVVGAHYDTARGTPGADANGSGVAALLELARMFSDRLPRLSVHFVFLVTREAPYFMTPEMGSRQYVAKLKHDGVDVVAMLSLEALGYYSNAPDSQAWPPLLDLFYPDRGDSLIFVGNMASAALVRRCVEIFRASASLKSEGLAAPTWIPGVEASDAAAFWEASIPAVRITAGFMGRNPNHRRSTDRPDTLDRDRFSRAVQGIFTVLSTLAN